jgi:hypothetical protein
MNNFIVKCVQCGIKNRIAENFPKNRKPVCSKCSRPLLNEVIDLPSLRAVCNQYRGSAPAYYLEPIPEKKATNAHENLHIPLTENIIALIDFTLFGSAKNAMVVTESGLYWKDDNDKYPFSISWAKLRHCKLSEAKGTHAKNIKFGDGLQMNLLGTGPLGEDGNHVVIQLLNDLKALAESVPEDQRILVISDGLDLSLLWDVCNRYRGSASEYYLDPVPEKRVNDARESLNVPFAEHIVALINFSSFGSAKNAMVVTESGLYWKSLGNTSSTSLSWDQVSKYSLSEERSLLSKSIVFDAGLQMSLYGATTFVGKDNHTVLELLNDIRQLANSGVADKQTGMGSEGSNSGLVKCEFCQGRIKSEVTYCKHCGIKLRG